MFESHLKLFCLLKYLEITNLNSAFREVLNQ